MLKLAFLLCCICGCCFGAVFPTKQIEDAEYWKNSAKKHLQKVLLEKTIKPSTIAKNVIVFIGDGMGMSTITASRIFKGQLKGTAGEDAQLVFEMFPNIGLAKTYNVDKQVPDSAGSATALFTGVKTNYGVIGMDASINKTHPINISDDTDISKKKLTSIIEWAINAKKRTGIVTTTRITHATPAALYATAPTRDFECDTQIPLELRDYYKDIGRQLIEDKPGKYINVLLGGGKQMLGTTDSLIQRNQPIFTGSAERYCTRSDGKDLINDWLLIDNDNVNDNQRKFVRTRNELFNINANDVDYLLGLFADNHMSYNCVRDKTNETGEPSISEMTARAIDILNNDKNENGWLLVVEGGRIDQAHHQNYAKMALEEVIEFDIAIEVALNATKHLSNTLIIVTADHSHAMTLNGYAIRGNDILAFANRPDEIVYETLTYANGPGFHAHRLNAMQLLTKENRDNTWIKVDTISDYERNSPMYQHQAMMSSEDETHGGEDVPVYGYGPGSYLIAGTFEQNYIPYIISYSACIGPVSYLNELCVERNFSNLITIKLKLIILSFFINYIRYIIY